MPILFFFSGEGKLDLERQLSFFSFPIHRNATMGNQISWWQKEEQKGLESAKEENRENWRKEERKKEKRGKILHRLSIMMEKAGNFRSRVKG